MTYSKSSKREREREREMAAFEELGLNPSLILGVEELGWVLPTGT